MNWKQQLAPLEYNKKWDEAIEFMQEVIAEYPNDLDAYLNINYLIMNLLVEEDYDVNKHDYYAELLKKYFDESYAKFSENPEYLYYIGRIAAMSEWYFGIEPENIDIMLKKALLLDPKNIIYQWKTYYRVHLDKKNIQDTHDVISYVKQITKDSSTQEKLKSKGALGEYIWGMMENWSKRMLKEYEDNKNDNQ